MFKTIRTLMFTLALGLGIWTLAVTLTPIASVFQAGQEVSAAAFNALFTAIGDNFVLVEDAINQNEADITQNASDIADLQGNGLALPFDGTVDDANTAFTVVNTGAGGAGRFEVDNPLSTNTALTVVGEGQQGSLALSVSSFGLGGTALFSNFTGGNDQDVIRAIHGGDGSAGSFETTNSGSTSPTLESTSNGGSPFVATYTGNNFGTAIEARNTGTGFGLEVSVSNAANTLPALSVVSNNAFNPSMVVGNNGGGPAGNFQGSVTINGDLNVIGDLSKGSGSFKIDHPLDPENQYLYHSFVESPDMMNIYNGNVTLDASGNAVVEMPDWFEALNMEFRYQLTAIGAPGPNLYISETMTDNRFAIAGGTPDMEVSWQVTGIRHDPFAEMNRIQVEVAKPLAEQGTYLHPEAYGQPAELGVAAAYQAQLEAQPETLEASGE